MKTSTLKYTVLSVTAFLALFIMAVIPFHALLTVWIASNFDHYTAIRLWKEVILIFCAIGALLLMVIDNKIRAHTLTRRLVWTIFAYILVTVFWAAIAYHRHDVSLKAAAYGVLLNTRYLIFFLVTWSLALRTAKMRTNWQRLVLIPAAIVVSFGLLQTFVLPNDILRHIGYSASTIYPYETINHNEAYIRIQSTLRGANPLGAYLLLPLSILFYAALRRMRDWRLWAGVGATLIVLFMTFSRSAWIGAACMMLLIVTKVCWSPPLRKWLYAGVISLILFVGLLGLVVHRSAQLENIVFHTQTNSTIKISSNQGHNSAVRNGIHDVVFEPLGRGPGSAGPASVYNNHPVRIAENYYLQIGQEIGWIGLGLFLGINAVVGYLLWSRRNETFGFVLLASFIGLSIINCFSHAWTDDTIAYLWWGLAGIAMAPWPLKSPKGLISKMPVKTNAKN